MSRLNRRDFLKAVGLTGTVTAAAACRWDDNRYVSPIEELLPYVLKEEDQVPGTPTFFPTTVTTGIHAYAVNGRNREGRVINIGANPQSPFGAGVPSDALLALQRHYSPDRLQAPGVVTGDGLSPVSWDDAIERVSGAIGAAGSKKVAYLGPYRSGSIVTLIDELTKGESLFWEPLGYDAEVDAAEALFGQRILPGYDLTKAHYILSFGAEFLGGWGGTKLEAQYAEARHPGKGGFIARFAYVGPHLDQTAANSDDWYNVPVEAQALVARALVRLVADKKNTGAALGANLPGAEVVGQATSASGLSAEQLEQIASQLASVDSVVLPGGTAGASAAAKDLAAATYLLNLACGAAGVTFGMGRHYAGPVSSSADLMALKTALDAGQVAVLLIDDVNPAYNLPADLGMAESIAKADMVVSLSSFVSETSKLATLVLPTHDELEDWGDEEPEAGLTLLRQPTMRPLYNTRSLGDLLLTFGKANAPATPPAAVEDTEADTEAPATDDEASEEVAPVLPPLGFAPASWREYVVESVRRKGLLAEPFGQSWYEALSQGFIEAPGRALTPPALSGTYAFGPAPSPTGSGEITLHTYPHPFRKDGRYSNEPWAQEVPDPMSGRTWGSWGELHPETAASLGIEDSDLIRVTSGDKTIEVAAELTPGIRKGIIAVAFGQGHTGQGMYADKFGANVVDLLSASGGLKWQGTRVSITKAGGKANVPSVLGGDNQGGRALAPVVPADALLEVGDAPQEHPGELTGIVHLARDGRLEDRGKLDFYPVPDHPNYRWAMTVDTNACNGCGVCSMACYAENNLPVVGRELIALGREMNWIRINRYWETNPDGSPDARFLPVMCQQCGHAPCESVCPVLATYHSLEGLNAMVYNRCVGTRYCANNCPYQARRFNYHSYHWPEPFNLQLNPDVSTRQMGVMEKCSFCVQRTREMKGAYRDQGFDNKVPSADMEQLPACAEACPSKAITFGNLNEDGAFVKESRKSARSYMLLDELRTFPAVNYLGRASFHAPMPHHGGHGGGHGDEHAAGHGDEHGADHGDAHQDDNHAAPAPEAGHGSTEHEAGHDAGAH